MEEPCEVTPSCDPTGWRTWDCTVALTNWLRCLAEEEQPLPLPCHLSSFDLVLELGAGTGDLACTLAALGARHIVTTERDDEIVLARMMENVRSAGLEKSIKVEGLDWGDLRKVKQLTEPLDDVSSIVVVASECLHWQGTSIFDHDPLQDLARTIAAALLADGFGAKPRIALIAYRQRAEARESMFAAMLEELGVEEAFPRLSLNAWATESPGDFVDDVGEKNVREKACFWLIGFKPRAIAR
eukprot:TRINITY_DN53543_c0_g1_i1.p1 TRINITY_DN53543_c0_g1~~TRINITY_DN53543_c0_g1_i1.p1  ORF type:complete len:242 (-),score=56.81 TRINITY_DN53543_c0_g1_i1:16-741(-)